MTGKRLFALLGVVVLLLSVSSSAFAIPSLQVYIDGATEAGDHGADEDSWWASVLPGAFNLLVIGAYTGNTNSITNGTLLITVPQGESGSIAINGNGVNGSFNSLSNIPLPSGLNGMANHYPVGDEAAYQYFTYNIGSFNSNTTGLYNYNGGDGSISWESNAEGEVKNLTINASGFSSMHFDAYALFNNRTWNSNPNSHDSTATGTAVPEPAALSLLGFGLLGAFGFSRFKK